MRSRPPSQKEVDPVKRNLTSLVVAGALVAGAVSPAMAALGDRYQVTFNGRQILFDVQPEVKNSRTFVPFRAIFEKMGAEVSFDAGTSTVTASRDGKSVRLTIGSTTGFVNGASATLDAAPYISDSRTMVPLRFVSEAFGATVSYNEVQDRGLVKKIEINDPNWPRRGGTLNLALYDRPQSGFNPIMANDTYTSDIMDLMYDGLWASDESFQPQPALAESWEWSADEKQITFHLRKGAMFFDGTPITAKDWVFTYKAIAHPRYMGPRNSGFEAVLGWADYNAGKKGESAADFENGFVSTGNIEGIVAVDDYTLVFKLDSVNAAFLMGQAVYGTVDSKRYASIPVQDWGTARDPNVIFPNGTGAFKMNDYAEGRYASLVANPNYWNGKPYMDKVLYRIISSDVTLGEMQIGNLDVAEFTSPSSLPAYNAIPHVEVAEFPGLVYQLMWFNTRDSVIGQKEMRHAIAYAIDKEAIIHNLMEDHASPLYAPLHPVLWASTDDVEQYAFNPTKSGQILDSLGYKMGNDGFRYKDGKKLTIELTHPNTGNPVRIKTAPVVQKMLQDVGIDLQLVGYETGTAFDKILIDHDFQLGFMGFSLSIDPDPDGIWSASAICDDCFNGAQWTTPLSEQLILKGKSTNDIEKRIEAYHEWAKHWADELPAYLFYAPNTFAVANKRVGNWRPGTAGTLWGLEDIYLKN